MSALKTCYFHCLYMALKWHYSIAIRKTLEKPEKDFLIRKKEVQKNIFH